MCVIVRVLPMPGEPVMTLMVRRRDLRMSLSTSSVMAHNVLGIRDDGSPGSSKRLLHVSRMMAVLITGLGVIFALRVPQTGTLLVLAFDIGFAALLVPLVAGLFWKNANSVGALGCIVVGTGSRLIFFVLCPTIYGVDNTLFYVPNDVLLASFEGVPTFISPAPGAATYFALSSAFSHVSNVDRALAGDGVADPEREAPGVSLAP